jgi:hypothetical protein
MRQFAGAIRTAKAKSRIESIDKMAGSIGHPLRKEGISIILFGDSAVEEETKPDSDMIDDNIQIGKAVGDNRRAIEATPIEQYLDGEFRAVPYPGDLDSEYQLDYFIDGSIRTKYIGEIVTPSGRGGALMAASLGAVAVRVDYQSMKVKPAIFKSELVVYMVNDIPDSTKDVIKNNLDNLTPPVLTEFITQEQAQMNIRGSAGGKARSKMHSIEIDVAKSIGHDRKWIAVDGALRKKEFIDLERAIGIAKSFGGKVTFLGSGRPKTISYLAKMKKGERSPVYRYSILNPSEESEEKDSLEKIAFWYVRIRQPPPEMMPLGGIVKIDISYKESSQYHNITEVADKISASILRIADPSIFPRPRWPSFVYPVRVAEECLQPLLFSDDEFLRLGVSLKSVMYNE